MASLEPSERKAVPFLRVWCLAEIAAAFASDTPLVLACGKHAVKRLSSSESQVYFETNTALLYNMQFLVSVEHAEATVASDKDMILDRVRASVGVDVVNRRVRGAIIGAMVSSRAPAVSLAVAGSRQLLEQVVLGLTARDEGQPQAAIDAVVDAACAAAAGGHCAILTEVLSALSAVEGADKAARVADSDLVTPLMHAVQGGHLPLVQNCLALRFDPNAMSSNRWTPLMYAAQFGCPSICAALVKAGAEAKVEGGGGLSALAVACQGGSDECARVLLEAGATMQSKDGVGYTPLMHASKFGHVNVLKVLFEYMSGDDLNEKDNWNATPLIHAVEQNQMEAVVALLTADESARGVERCRVNEVHVSKKNPTDRKTALDVCLGEGEENKGGKGVQLAMQVCLKRFGGKTIEELEGGKEHADTKAGAL
jgi:ankyrin repeat protein